LAATKRHLVRISTGNGRGRINGNAFFVRHDHLPFKSFLTLAKVKPLSIFFTGFLRFAICLPSKSQN
jgi:hypothetical protein